MGFPNGMEYNMAKSLCTLIQSQHKLKEFKLCNSIRYTSFFISTLSNHCNHLKRIILFNTKIDNIDTWKILSSRFNLENFEIINCVGSNNNDIINLKKLKCIENQQNDYVNDGLHKKEEGLIDYRFLKSGINNVVNTSCNNKVILNKGVNFF